MKATAILVASTIALTSCGGSPEQDFLDYIHKTEPTAVQTTDALLLAGGQTICAFYAKDGQPGITAALENVGATQGAEPQRLMTIVATAARKYLCP